MAAAVVVACSSSSNSNNNNSNDVTSACYAQCDQQAKATGCGSGGITDAQCHSICDAFIPSFSPDCQAKAKASWQCGASATWSCAMGGNFPQKTGTQCDAVDTAYARRRGRRLSAAHRRPPPVLGMLHPQDRK
jgi:hypothetical protein